MKKLSTILVLLFANIFSLAQTSTVTDIDGNVYQTVVIGEQEWMTENLKVIRYQNGDVIPEGPDQDYFTPEQHYYFYYDHDFQNIEDYGLLYTGYVVLDDRNVCPVGWKIPSFHQWQALDIFLGMSWGVSVDPMEWVGTDEGGKLKTVGYSHWQVPNVGATDEHGFSALPGGLRGGSSFFGLGQTSYFWTSTERTNTSLKSKHYNFNTAKTGRRASWIAQSLSIRCIRIQSEQALPSITTSSVFEIQASSAKFSANVIDDGNSNILAMGVCYGTNPEPTLEVNDGYFFTSEPPDTGEFNTELVDLIPGETYYARPYALNAKGLSYGEEVSFQTAYAQLPAVTDPTLSNLDHTFFTLSASVTNQGQSAVISRGFVLSEAVNPTINDNKIEVGGDMGEFTADITGLKPNTRYYYRAYATNSHGTTHSYHRRTIITPPDNLPSPSKPIISNITQTSAIIESFIEDDGGYEIFDKGIRYSWPQGETLDISFGPGVGEIILDLTELSPNVEYTVRAYAINQNGLVFSDQEKFFTLFSNTQQAMALLNDLYRHMSVWGPGWGYPYGYGNHDNFGFKSFNLTSDLMGEDIVVHSAGYGWFNAHYRYISHRNKNASLVLYTWSRFYYMIDKANYILDHLDQAAGFQPVKDKIKGQLLALRAFCHFQLVQVFSDAYAYDPQSAGIPYLTESIKTISMFSQLIEQTQPKQAKSIIQHKESDLINKKDDKNSFPGQGTGILDRGTVGDVYNYMVNDLDLSVYLLASSSEQEHPTHISLAVAHGIRARVALAMEDFSSASFHASGAINAFGSDNLFSVDDYPDEFELIYQNNQVVGYNYTAMSGFNKASLSSEWMWGSVITAADATIYASFWSHMDPRFMTYASLGGQKKITLSLYDQISDSDVRKNLWVPPNISFTGTYAGFGADIPPLCQMKFLVQQLGSWSGDYLYMRLAEMFLIKAEAQAKLGQHTAAAQTLYDLVSTRDPEYQMTTNTGEDLKEEVLLHRRIELWGEGHGYLDLRRLQKPLNRPSGTGNHNPSFANIMNLPANDEFFLWAIPFHYDLTINVVGNGNVEVNSEPYTDKLFVARDSDLVLSAIPASGGGFVNWTDEDGEISYEYTFTYNMPAEDVTITANFDQNPTYTLSLSTSPANSGSLSGGGNYHEGASVNVVATAYQGYEFINWADIYGNTVSNEADFEYIMPAENMTLTANFNVISDVKTLLFDRLQIFPNPFTNSIIIENAQGVRKIELSNLFGQKVLEVQLQGVKSTTISTESLSKGIYLIIIEGDNGEREVRKMVKE